MLKKWFNKLSISFSYFFLSVVNFSSSFSSRIYKKNKKKLKKYIIHFPPLLFTCSLIPYPLYYTFSLAPLYFSPGFPWHPFNFTFISSLSFLPLPYLLFLSSAWFLLNGKTIFESIYLQQANLHWATHITPMSRIIHKK